MPDKSPKLIATINFKGGVGKTTVTWCLGDVLSYVRGQRVLMFDLDAQMSLTQAIALNENTGNLEDRFGTWYDTSVKHKKTIFHALDAFDRPGQKFDFGVGLTSSIRFPSSYISSLPLKSCTGKNSMSLIAIL